MPISTEDFNKFSKSALAHYLKNPVVDQIGTETPLLNKLKARRKQFNGGLKSIVVQLRKSYDDNFKWAYGESEVEFNTRDTLAQAEFNWARCEDGFRISYDDLFQNGLLVKEGKSKEFSLTSNEKVILTNIMEEQLEAFKCGYDNKLSLELHRDGSASDDAVVGLDALISTTPATGTVGGINRATATYWQNNAATNIPSTTAGRLALTMEAMWRQCIRNGGQPDYILCGSDFIDAYRQYAITVTNNANAGAVKRIDAGVGNGTSTGLYFKGVELVWDPQFEDLDALESPLISWEKRCYFINTRFLELHDSGVDVVSPTRPHDTLSYFQMATQRLALVMKRANAHAVLSIA